MSRTTGAGTRSLLDFANTIRMCSLYELKPINGLSLFLTNHQRAIIFENRTYEPSGGLQASAYTGATGLEDATAEVSAAITSDKITIDDLRRGVYRGATLIERVVDWRYPWAGALMTYRFVIEDIQYDGKIWKAQLHGLASLLNQKRGGFYVRSCPVRVGHPDCAIVNLPDFTEEGVEVTAVVDSRTFTATGISGGFDSAWFEWGRLEWGAGSNRFRTSMVYDYDDSTSTFKIVKPPTFDIVVGDVFNVTAGCDGRFLTCKAKFANHHNFQGMIYTRGTSQTIATPRTS